ncbi:hypothetical protein [Pararhizobium sp.]|uniref:hypothetical protein n=1 Tax=Pararhizobium sp. TaxID=1977563 RepID=UPI003D0AD9F1
MTNTIDTSVSTSGDAFQAMLLDSERVFQIFVAGGDVPTVHTLLPETTLIMVAVSADVSSVGIFRGEEFDGSKTFPFTPSYFPLNVPGGARILHIVAPTDTVVVIQEN